MDGWTRRGGSRGLGGGDACLADVVPVQVVVVAGAAPLVASLTGLEEVALADALAALAPAVVLGDGGVPVREVREVLQPPRAP